MEVNDIYNSKNPVFLSSGDIIGLSSAIEFLTSFASELESIIKQVEALAVSDARRREEIKQSYEAERVGLEARLQKKDETLLAKDSVIKELQESLTSKLQEFEILLEQKNALLKNHDIELERIQIQQTAQFEAVIKQVEATAASEAQRAQVIKQTFDTERAALETRLGEKEEILLAKETTIRQLQDGVTGRIQELENLLAAKEGVVKGRDNELKNLQLKIEALTSHTTRLESEIEQAEAIAAAEAQQVRDITTRYESEKALWGSTLREKDKSISEKALAAHALRKNLTSKVRELEEQLQEKTLLLQSRQSELHDLRANADELKCQVAHLEAVSEQLQAGVAGEAQRAEAIKQSFETEKATLIARLREMEGTLLAKDSEFKALQETFTARFQEFEELLGQKNTLLKSQNAQLDQKELLVKKSEDEISKLAERMSAEIRNLTAELIEKKIALASYEKSHWRSLGRRNFWKRLFRVTYLAPSTISGRSPESDSHQRTELPAKSGSGLKEAESGPCLSKLDQPEASGSESHPKKKKIVNLKF